MKLVIGLGNPGKEYVNTRHNLGFMVLDEMVKEHWEESKKFRSAIAKAKDIIFAKPQTFMNNSGRAVRLLADYYKIQPEDIAVVYDELDLPLGEIRIRKEGSAAGHHGIESVIEALGSDRFIRIRLGIGPSSGSAENFVLENFLPEEEKKVKEMIKEAIIAIDSKVISL